MGRNGLLMRSISTSSSWLIPVMKMFTLHAATSVPAEVGEIDRINKPFLPVAAGELSVFAARRIVALCAVVPVVLALTQGPVELGGVLAGLAVGTAYSVPAPAPQALPAAGRAEHHRRPGARGQPRRRTALQLLARRRRHDPGPVWALCLFVIPFAFAISILKDVPDAEGDRRHRIATSRYGSGRGACSTWRSRH